MPHTCRSTRRKRIDSLGNTRTFAEGEHLSLHRQQLCDSSSLRLSWLSKNMENYLYCDCIKEKFMSPQKIFTALIVSLSSFQCPSSYAQVLSVQGSEITGKLNAAFGNNNLFNEIALEFVDNSNADFSCKWWVMKASQQHESDVNQINNSEKKYVSYVIAARQKYMMESIFPPLNRSCSR